MQYKFKVRLNNRTSKVIKVVSEDIVEAMCKAYDTVERKGFQVLSLKQLNHE